MTFTTTRPLASGVADRAAEADIRVVVCGGPGDGRRTLIDRLSSAAGGASPAMPPSAVSGRRIVVAEGSGDACSARHVLGDASTADCHLVLVDAAKGVVTETRRIGYVLALLQVRHIVLVVNKMDGAAYSQAAFEQIERDYRQFLERVDGPPLTCIPASALLGDNVAARSAEMPWYAGPTLVECLQARPSDAQLSADVDGSGETNTGAGQPAVADQFQATIVWLHARPMLPGRAYATELGPERVTATIAPLKHAINVSTLEHVAASQLQQEEIGICQLALDRPVAFEPYRPGSALGLFRLGDPTSGELAGFGILQFALRRSENLRWQAFDVDRQTRAELKRQKPCVLWFTGLSGAGKSTIANLVERRLFLLGHHTYVLDGDNVRHGLNRDLGFTAADRVENIRRVAEVARLMADAGLIVLVAFISPFRAERRMARELLEAGEFVEIFVETPLEVAEARDPKGLYKKARHGQLKNFTGIDSPYERPESPDLQIDTTAVDADAAADMVLSYLRAAGVIRTT